MIAGMHMHIMHCRGKMGLWIWSGVVVTGPRDTFIHYALLLGAVIYRPHNKTGGFWCIRTSGLRSSASATCNAPCSLSGSLLSPFCCSPLSRWAVQQMVSARVRRWDTYHAPLDAWAVCLATMAGSPVTDRLNLCAHAANLPHSSDYHSLWIWICSFILHRRTAH